MESDGIIVPMKDGMTGLDIYWLGCMYERHFDNDEGRLGLEWMRSIVFVLLVLIDMNMLEVVSVQ